MNTYPNPDAVRPVGLTATDIAWDRDETEPCQKGTIGCCVDHPQGPETDCETW